LGRILEALMQAKILVLMYSVCFLPFNLFIVDWALEMKSREERLPLLNLNPIGKIFYFFYILPQVVSRRLLKQKQAHGDKYPHLALRTQQPSGGLCLRAFEESGTLPR
jgi:hypothetical protein